MAKIGIRIIQTVRAVFSIFSCFLICHCYTGIQNSNIFFGRFKTVWIPEHHFINLLVHPNPLLTGVRVAAATRTIRIGTSVLVLPFFDMRRLAGEVAMPRGGCCLNRSKIADC